MSIARRLGVMDDSNEPAGISSNVEDRITVNIIGILEFLTYFREIVPAGGCSDPCPSLNFTRCILVLLHRLAQMLAGNHMHKPIILHIL